MPTYVAKGPLGAQSPRVRPATLRYGSCHPLSTGPLQARTAVGTVLSIQGTYCSSALCPLQGTHFLRTGLGTVSILVSEPGLRHGSQVLGCQGS